MAKKPVVTDDPSDPLSPNYEYPSGASSTPMYQPINPFADKKAGFYPQQNAASYTPPVQKPAYQPVEAAGTFKTPDAPANPASYLAPIAAGFDAGSQAQPTRNSAGAVMSTVGAGVQGSVAGAALGSAIPGIGTAVGAGVGGLVGLVSGGIQSYFNLKQARSDKREQDKNIAYIRKQNEDAIAYQKQQNAQAETDKLEQLRYNRRQNAISSQWDAFKSVQSILANGMKENEDMKSLFLQRGR